MITQRILGLSESSGNILAQIWNLTEQHKPKAPAYAEAPAGRPAYGTTRPSAGRQIMKSTD
jgi:hypothetical protein